MILIVCPTGSCSPKRLSTTVWPSSATLVALFTSCWVKGLPATRSQSRTVRISGVVPMTPVDQFRWPDTTWATPDRDRRNIGYGWAFLLDRLGIAQVER